MREFFFVFVVILVLLGLTAIRYRKQIVSFIGFARMMKDVKDQAGATRTLNTEKGSGQLVNCSKCGVWIPQNKAIARGNTTLCSNCLQTTDSQL